MGYTLTQEARTPTAVFSMTMFLTPFIPSGIRVMRYMSPFLTVATKRSPSINTALEQSIDKGAGLWRRRAKLVEFSV